MDAHTTALRLRQRITELDAAESALDDHLIACRAKLARRSEWRWDYQVLDDRL
ncbi:hypothetical protein [Nocardia sp. NPDC004722]